MKLNNLFACSALLFVIASCSDEELPTEPVVSDKIFEIAENSANGTIVGMAVEEPEANVNFEFGIVAGDPENVFSINSADGTLTVVNSAELDYEKTNKYELAINVYHKKSKLSGVFILSVFVVNVIEWPVSGLVARYHFTDGSLMDLSGNGNHLTNMNVQSTDNRFLVANQSMVFDSQTDYLKVASPSFLGNDTGTFAAWVKFSSVDQTQYIGSVGDEASIESYLSFIRLDGTKKVLGVYQREPGLANWVEGTTVIDVNKYYFLVLRSNGASWTMYIDGKEEPLTVRVGSNTGKWAGLLSGLDNFVIGNLLIQEPYAIPNFLGKIDDVLLYDRALDECEISAMYEDSKF